MLAFHSNSALPFLLKNRKPYSIDKFELYNTVLSALLWRKYNGKIIMIADKISYDYYLKLGIKDIWDDLVIGIPDDLEGINPKMFWAAGKILALRETPAPCVMLDTDFIVWNKMDFTHSVIAAHQENISPDVYPDFNYFKTEKGYTLNPRWKKDVLPLNTAFLYLSDEDFKQYYVNKSIEFMKLSLNSEDFLRPMVFAEQRMLALIIDELSIPYSTLLNKDKLFFPQENFTHLWGAKRIMRENKNEEIDFLNRCKKRISTDFPDYKYILELI